METLFVKFISRRLLSTLDRFVTHVRHGVHQDVYARITASLDASPMARLDALLHTRDGRTEFNRIKETPRQATLQHLHQWTQRLTWLESILPTRPFLKEIVLTKIQQFAAEASALEVGDMRDIHNRSRRYSLLICFLYHAQVQTRDQLVEMLLKRMRRTTTSAKQRLKELQDHYRELEEQMVAVFCIQHFQHTKRDYVPSEIALDFASVRWQALIRTRHHRETVLNRRQLEVCVFHYLDHGTAMR